MDALFWSNRFGLRLKNRTIWQEVAFRQRTHYQNTWTSGNRMRDRLLTLTSRQKSSVILWQAQRPLIVLVKLNPYQDDRPKSLDLATLTTRLKQSTIRLQTTLKIFPMVTEKSADYYFRRWCYSLVDVNLCSSPLLRRRWKPDNIFWSNCTNS